MKDLDDSLYSFDSSKKMKLDLQEKSTRPSDKIDSY